jgi:small subunit ribosomal protein S14
LPHLIGRTNRVVRDQKRRQTVAAFEVDRALYKAMAGDQSLPYAIRAQVGRLFQTELPRDSCVNRVANRCMLTGRQHGVYQEFRLSRIMFRRLAAEGMLPGVKKSSW